MASKLAGLQDVGPHENYLADQKLLLQMQFL